MLKRRPPLALLLAIALAAMGLSIAVGIAGDTSPHGKSGDGVATRAEPVEASLVRMSGEDRSESLRSQRSSKQRLLLLAITIALFVISALGRCRPVALDQPMRLQVSWWSPRTGRGPPSPQLLIS